ncbi:hypothetical protein FRC19_007099, partial [Serendipita sp. 401]
MGSGASRTRGPKTPQSISGSALGNVLKREGFRVDPDGMAFIKHVLTHKTRGWIGRAIWMQESSTLQHEYLLISVFFLNERLPPSWIRIERMGDLEGTRSQEEKDKAELIFHIAPQREQLTFRRDVVIADVVPDTAPTLRDLANLLQIIQTTSPVYSLLQYNCWFFAREVFHNLVSGYLVEGVRKRKLIELCESKRRKHEDALWRSPWRGQVFTGLVMVVASTAPQIIIPAYAMSSAILSRYNRIKLKSKTGKIRLYFEEYRKWWFQ